MRTPMPSPRGTNRANLFVDGKVRMALDAALRARRFAHDETYQLEGEALTAIMSLLKDQVDPDVLDQVAKILANVPDPASLSDGEPDPLNKPAVDDVDGDAGSILAQIKALLDDYQSGIAQDDPPDFPGKSNPQSEPSGSIRKGQGTNPLAVSPTREPTEPTKGTSRIGADSRADFTKRFPDADRLVTEF